MYYLMNSIDRQTSLEIFNMEICSTGRIHFDKPQDRRGVLDFVEVVADGGSSASSDKPTSLSSSRSLLTPHCWSVPAMFMLLMLLSPKNTSNNAYESFLRMDYMLFTCARFPILYARFLILFKFP